LNFRARFVFVSLFMAALDEALKDALNEAPAQALARDIAAPSSRHVRVTSASCTLCHDEDSLAIREIRGAHSPAAHQAKRKAMARRVRRLSARHRARVSASSVDAGGRLRV
jgi:cytochrome c5